MSENFVLFTAWGYESSRQKALVGGMVKNPAYLYESIEIADIKDIITTSKDDSFFLEQDGNRVKTNVLKGLLKYVYRIYAISKRARQLMSSQKSNVVLIHAHTPALAPLFIRREMAKLVITAHGTHWPEFKANHQVKGLRSAMVFAHAYAQMRLERYVYARADRVVSVSNYQVDELVGDYKIDPTKIVVIPNGVDQTVYKSSNEDQKDIDVLFVGRPVPKKGIMLLIDAIKWLQSQDQGKRISSTWVFGEGWVSEPNIGGYCKDRILTELDGQVYHNVAERDLAGVYRRAKIVVAPSTGYESLPTVLIEAIFSGAIPLATRQFGNVEIIPPELLFTEGNSLELATKIKSILEAPDYFQSLVKSIDMEPYKLKNCVNTHEAMYREVLDC